MQSGAALGTDWSRRTCPRCIGVKKCCVPFTSLSSQLASQRCDKMLPSQHEGKWCLQLKTMFCVMWGIIELQKSWQSLLKARFLKTCCTCFSIEWALDSTENDFFFNVVFFLASWSNLRCSFYEDMLHVTVCVSCCISLGMNGIFCFLCKNLRFIITAMIKVRS